MGAFGTSGGGHGGHDPDGNGWHTDPNEGKGGSGDGGGSGTELHLTLRQRLAKFFSGRTQPYSGANAERQPADYPAEDAVYTTGPDTVDAYHYHRQPTFHDQYAADSEAQQNAQPENSGYSWSFPGGENNPT